MVGILKTKRDRQWRRAQTEKKFNNTFRRFNNVGPLSLKYYLENSCKIIYRRAKSINEFEIIHAETLDEFIAYQKLRAKKERDTPKPCSCPHCRNPRHSCFNKIKITLQERRYLDSFYCENML